MSRTWLLLPGEYADGARVVETTLRPIRPVCLIPEDDPGLAAQFAGTRSLARGGHVGYALPYSRSEGLREPWRWLLDLLDPDRVYALSLSREPAVSPGVVNMHAPLEEPTKSLADRLTDDLGRLVYTAEGPEQLFVSSSTLLHSALRAVGEDLKPPDGERFVLVPRLPRWSSAYLPVIARYGCVDESSVNDALNRAYSYQYRFDLDLSEAVRIEEVGATEHLIEVLADDVGGLLDGDERAERAHVAAAHADRPRGQGTGGGRHPRRFPAALLAPGGRVVQARGGDRGRRRRGRLRAVLEPQVRALLRGTLHDMDAAWPPRAGRGTGGCRGCARALSARGRGSPPADGGFQDSERLDERDGVAGAVARTLPGGRHRLG